MPFDIHPYFFEENRPRNGTFSRSVLDGDALTAACFKIVADRKPVGDIGQAETFAKRVSFVFAVEDTTAFQFRNELGKEIFGTGGRSRPAVEDACIQEDLGQDRNVKPAGLQSPIGSSLAYRCL
jgi:hypothetical protein